ncbi:ribbon-helix-helix domain-containing protein [Hydrogenophaga atypica]|uniref:Ribbon-helix-helix domain-containing protein n=1 Tax=Hydrogenophaga atypica TaxID=249409 RepID=A0ABW2QQH4_9BURK
MLYSPSPPLPPHLPAIRHIAAPHRTTIRLERVFWLAIDRLAEKTGHTWSEWVATELTGKPDGIGAASWLRVRCLIRSTQGA